MQQVIGKGEHKGSLSGKKLSENTNMLVVLRLI
jgi:hypothetical protein